MATFTGTSGNDVAANPTLTGFTGGTLAELTDATGDTFNAGDGADSVQAGSGADTVNGEGGNDTLFGGGGTDSITGGTGNDFIGGNSGNDTLDGGDGTDTISFFSNSSQRGALVNMSAATATVGGISLLAGTARDEFNGTPGTFDTFMNFEQARGNNFADFFLGGAGFNLFEGRGGVDTYEGGNNVKFENNRLLAFQEAWNWVDYRNDGGTQGINVTLTNSSSYIDRIDANGTGGTGTDTFGNVGEVFVNINAIRGSMVTATGDVVTGNDYFNYFEGLQGNDTFNGGGGQDRSATRTKPPTVASAASSSISRRPPSRSAQQLSRRTPPATASALQTPSARVSPLASPSPTSRRSKAPIQPIRSSAAPPTTRSSAEAATTSSFLATVSTMSKQTAATTPFTAAPRPLASINPMKTAIR